MVLPNLPGWKTKYDEDQGSISQGIGKIQSGKGRTMKERQQGASDTGQTTQPP